MYSRKFGFRPEEYQLIDEKLTSQMVGRGLQTLRNDRSKNRGIPFYKIGKSVRYRLDEVIAYAERHRVETAGGGV
jgi:hypothetical protein